MGACTGKSISQCSWLVFFCFMWQSLVHARGKGENYPEPCYSQVLYDMFPGHRASDCGSRTAERWCGVRVQHFLD